MSIMCVSEIKESEDPAPIEVRVLKKWIPYHKKTDICYLFVDEHGCAIEATSSTNNKAHFDSIINVQSCYIIDDYICLPKRSYMPTVGHAASIRLGMKATFTPSSNNNIPDHYFDLATYSELMARTKDPKRLTDFIGRVISDKHKPVKSTTIRKIVIIDEDMVLSDRTLELTLWPNHNVKVPEKIEKGSIIAITSAEVKEYMGHPQLESSVATTIIVNPTYSEMKDHVNRLNRLMLPANEEQQLLTLVEILTKNPHKQPNNYRCIAWIKEISTAAKWFYVLCPECSNHMHPQRKNPNGFSCEDHKINKPPRFMYCVNTTITDNTADIPAVFFNEAMTTLLGRSCDDLIKTHDHKDPKNPPTPILATIGKTNDMMVTIKANRTLAVNSVRETQNNTMMDTPQHAQLLQPTTPATKGQSKRPQQEQSGQQEHSKKQKL